MAAGGNGGLLVRSLKCGVPPIVRLDCMADNQLLGGYYVQAGFEERGEIDAPFPGPVGTLRLRRYAKRVRTKTAAAQQASAADGGRCGHERPRLNRRR
jgi:hypothetical protein